MRKFKLLFNLGVMVISGFALHAQSTHPVNGVADERTGNYAFVNATIVKDAQTTLTNATMLVKDGKIVAVGNNLTVPQEAVLIDCKDKYIYPSFIDLYSDYGVAAPQRSQSGGFNFFAAAQLTSNLKGAYGWNQAIRTDVEASRLFNVDESKAKSLRDIGFGTVLSHQKDGIARGTGVVITLANEKENLVIVKEKASAHYSFSKGTSTQSYPSSMMGTISLLRQTYLDAAWYKGGSSKEGVNLTLKYWNEQQSLPQIFEANDKWNDLRADRIGDEFGVQDIIKGGGNEYQRMAEMIATKASFILPLNFPAAMDVDDPADLRFVGLDDLKNWELAPSNPAAFEKAGINFCLTTADLSNPSDFLTNLRKALEYGLTESKALESLTKNPASMLGIYDKVGSIEAGKLANFLIANGNVFQEKTTILQNWVQGKKYAVKDDAWFDIKGNYVFTGSSAAGTRKMMMELKEGGVASFIDKDTLVGKYSYDGKMVKLSFTEGRGPRASETIFSGIVNGNEWNGTGRNVQGQVFTWTAVLEKQATPKVDSATKKMPLQLGKVTFPFLAF